MRVLMLSMDQSVLQADSLAAKRLIEYGNLVEQLSVVVLSKNSQSTKLSDKVEVFPTNTKFKPCYFWQAYKLAKKIINNHRCDVITCQDPYFSGLVGWLLKRKFKIGLNIQLHGDFFGNNYWAKNNCIKHCLAKFIIKRADSIRAVSQRIAASLNQFHIDQNEIVVAPIYAEVNQSSLSNNHIDLHQEFPGKQIILTVSRLVKEKNIQGLIEAFKVVNQKYPDTVLIIVGDGLEREKLEVRSKQLDLDNLIIFKGWQNELAGYYQTADIYVLNSFSEGYNLSVLEAMANGLPVIMTDVGVAGEVVQNKLNGLIVTVNNQKDLIQAIEYLLVNEDERRKMKEAAGLTIQNLPNKSAVHDLIVKSWQLAVK